MDKAPISGSSSGPSIDRVGTPVIDPTSNVISLTEAANRRQDDLREANEKFSAAEVEHVKEIGTLRAEYDEKLRQAEAKRIDAIRAVDVNAVAVASQRASDQATVLATQLAQSAEASRGLVATTASTVAQSQQQLANTLSARLTALEQAQYEGKGKSAYVDPTITEMAAQIRKLANNETTTGGARAGAAAVIAYVISGIIALAGLTTFIVGMMKISGR